VKNISIRLREAAEAARTVATAARQQSDRRQVVDEHRMRTAPLAIEAYEPRVYDMMDVGGYDEL